MANPALRQRSTQPPQTTPQDRVNAKVEIEDQGPIISLPDLLRIILTLLFASAALSYYLTSGESFLWNFSPWFLKLGALKSYLRGPVLLTPAELALYNGSSPDLPIYLSINHTIFDVSASPHTYGPGGSYHVFAGRDATRAFVTGCFADDTTSDLRGAEEVYMLVDDPDDPEEQALSSGEKKLRAERERREARKRVQKEVEKWSNFYRNNEKYFEVGKLVVVPEVSGGEPPKLCESAQKGRPKRRRRKPEHEVHGKGKPVQ